MSLITLSTSAIEQIKNAAQQDGNQSSALRIAARMGADETIEYGMGFDEAKDDDAQEIIEGITIVIAPDCVELLNGARMDFVEIEPGKTNFIFLNPNDPSYKPPTEDGALDPDA